MLIIGLDAASQRSNFGYAVAWLGNGNLVIEEAGLLESEDDGEDRILSLGRRLAGASEALIAVDAPLGWPAEMGRVLAAHRAGFPIPLPKDQMFRRVTDRFVAQTFGKTPLEVGADKIARASHEALRVLGQLRADSGKPIPLAWNPQVDEACVIEVYPAATLKARRLRDTGYKKTDQAEQREGIARALLGRMPDLNRYVGYRADVFDACLCALAAADFLHGETLAPSPEDMAAVRREGWIWVRRPAADQRETVED